LAPPPSPPSPFWPSWPQTMEAHSFETTSSARKKPRTAHSSILQWQSYQQHENVHCVANVIFAQVTIHVHLLNMQNSVL